MIMKLELAGISGYDAALYSGTGCFHRRESLSGKQYSKDYRGDRDIETKKNDQRSVHELEEASKVLANCNYEKNTQWGKEVSLLIFFFLFLLFIYLFIYLFIIYFYFIIFFFFCCVEDHLCMYAFKLHPFL